MAGTDGGASEAGEILGPESIVKELHGWLVRWACYHLPRMYTARAVN